MNQKSFTLIELIITVVILSVIAALSLNHFQRVVCQRSVDKAYADAAAITAAQQIYKAKHGSYLVFYGDARDADKIVGTDNLDTLNKNLGLNISLDNGWMVLLPAWRPVSGLPDGYLMRYLEGNWGVFFALTDGAGTASPVSCVSTKSIDCPPGVPVQ